MFKTRVLSFLLYLFITSSFAQAQSDLGLIFSRNNYGNIGLEYRHGINEKSMVTAGVFYGSYNSYFSSSGSKVISASDSIVILRKYHSAHDGFSLRLGYAKEVINMFSLGGHILLDYQRSYTGSNDIFTTKDIDGSWSLPTTYNQYTVYSGSPEITQDTTWAGVYHHYFKPGIQLYASMNIPLGDRFLLNLSAACAMQYWIYLGESQLHDPNNEFAYDPGSIFSFDTRLNIGLRYKFGVGKE